MLWIVLLYIADRSLLYNKYYNKNFKRDYKL